MQDIDWKEINSRLPIEKTKEDAAKRKKMFRAFDGNGNGFLSLAECDKGIRDVLKLEQLFDCKQPIMRAFQAAKNRYKSKSKYGVDYVEFNEFRFFLIYLRQYFEYYVMFCSVDKTGDHKINLEEFKAAIPQIEKWGVKIENPEETFASASGGDNIIFTEFCEWAIKKSIDLEDDEDIDVEDQLK